MGLFLGKAHESPPPSPLPLTSAGFFAALVAALWAYDGWNNVSMVASEVREPQRNLPHSINRRNVSGNGDLFVRKLGLFSRPDSRTGGSESACRRRDDAACRWRMGRERGFIAAMISIFAALNGSILTGSRVPYAAARDGLFFRAIAWVHPQFRTPGVSIVALTLWASVLIVLPEATRSCSLT